MNESLGKAVRVAKVRSTNTSAVIVDYDAFMNAYSIDFRRNEAEYEREVVDAPPGSDNQENTEKKEGNLPF